MALKKDRILQLKTNSPKELEEILKETVRIEKLCVKEEKLRTFIADDSSRGDMVAHVYDVTYGIVENNVDTLVLLDDSIVRGTTLKNSIIKIIARLKPKKIIIVSSAPQIRYPDCYGIDMSKIGEFVAFKAAIALLKKSGQEHIIHEVYEACKAQEFLPIEQMTNQVKRIYEPFTDEEISNKIAKIVTPKSIDIPINIIFQTIEGLHAACPKHKGDWYFSGNYPTPGGNRVVNRAFINYIENKNERAY